MTAHCVGVGSGLHQGSGGIGIAVFPGDMVQGSPTVSVPVHGIRAGFQAGLHDFQRDSFKELEPVPAGTDPVAALDCTGR